MLAFIEIIELINAFHVTGFFLYLLKNIRKLEVSWCFRGYKKDQSDKMGSLDVWHNLLKIFKVLILFRINRNFRKNTLRSISKSLDHNTCRPAGCILFVKILLRHSEQPIYVTMLLSCNISIYVYLFYFHSTNRVAHK